ncbi:ribonuclease E inhibitor RraB [Rhodococcus jostii]|uniref:Regulator of ribonuclease activity B n=1 Tax=Rhodococcus jostii TaxID=132919 RepID=A0A1H4V325_RHOJO|nr:ribonuclease E inhibitor RraB [Rhodococcus jostii]SEC75048.1 Regulator of ribonuclease activity B [Rhodococcus jostii]
MRSRDNSTGWLRRLFGSRQPAPLDQDRRDLVVVASSFDDVEACSTVLDRAAAEDPRWEADAEAVLRHHLRLPAAAAADAASIAAQDGYRPQDPDETPSSSSPDEADATVALVLQRVQILDALHCSQERSRMAGLAQRLGGSVDGWDAMQPARESDPAGD